MCNCCVQTVPPGSSYEAFAGPVRNWQAALTTGLDRSLRASDHNLGHIEEEIAQKTRDLQRMIAQEAAQKKADDIPPACPVCGAKLTRVTPGHERTIQTRFGPITIQRSRGWCPKCKEWFFPADRALGIDDGGTASPAVQEMAALLGSKMPMSEASAVVKRLTGVDLPRPTLIAKPSARENVPSARAKSLMSKCAPPVEHKRKAKAASAGPLPWFWRSTPGTSASGMIGGKPSGSGPAAKSRSVGIGFTPPRAFDWRIG